MAKQNFLLGRGERLSEDVLLQHGGGLKEAPHTFKEAQDRLAPMVVNAAREIDDLPAEACPGDEAVISLTLNPGYLAKSYYPTGLLREAGIRAIGSRSKMITPDKRSRGREPVETVTTELFAKGPRASIRGWSLALPEWRPDRPGADDLASIEEVAAPEARDKVKGSLPVKGQQALEIVLHADDSDSFLVEAFAEYLDKRKIEAKIGRRFFVKGLCFLQIDALVEQAEEIATFIAVRTLRQMPKLRTLRPALRSAAIPATVPDMPEDPPVSDNVRVAIFDAGLPDSHPLTK